MEEMKMDLEKNDMEKNNTDSVKDTQLVSSDEQAVAPKFELVVHDKTNDVETRYPLEENREVIVGAGPESDVLIDGDEYLSWKHFSVKLVRDRVEVKDLGSRNGLYLKLDSENVQVAQGQTLLAGKTTFKLEGQQGGSN
jgi:hypothetical protein